MLYILLSWAFTPDVDFSVVAILKAFTCHFPFQNARAAVTTPGSRGTTPVFLSDRAREGKGSGGTEYRQLKHFKYSDHLNM